MMKRFMVSALAALFLLASAVQANAETMTVAVGIVPEAAFVEAVAGDLVHVVTLIPTGYSPANYQPTATEMRALSDASIYFTLQMPTEQANILPKVRDFNADIVIVDLREAAAAVYPLLAASEEESHEDGDHEGHDHGDVDPHIWLSPKRAIVMVRTIANELVALDPVNEAVYQANAAAYIEKLVALDSEIQEKTAALTNRAFIIYHGAYGYFADDYGLRMVAIEIAGKQATAEELQQVIDYARENGIDTVFYQAEFDDNQAATVAEEIEGTVQQTSPLSKDYIQGLEDFVNALARINE